RLAVHLRVHPEHQLAREGPLRLLPYPDAGLQIILDGFVKGFAQPLHRVGVEAYPVADARDPADEEAVLVVIVDAGRIALVTHGIHGLTPMRSRKSRAART